MSLIFNAECNYPLTFKHCFNILKEQISEFNFVFTKEGIQIQQQNNIKNTDIDIFLEASAFQNYEIKTEEPIIIGVNILNVFRIFKIITVKDSGLQFRVIESENFNGNTRDLYIDIINSKHAQISTTRCNKIDLNLIQFPHFNLSDYHAVVDISSQDFQEIINKLKNLGNKNSKEQDTIICYDNKYLSFIVDEGEYGSPSIISKEIKNNAPCGFRNTTEDNVNNEVSNSAELNTNIITNIDSVSYSISVKLFKLMELMRCTSLTTHVIMYIDNDKPLIIHYSVGILGYMMIRLN